MDRESLAKIASGIEATADHVDYLLGLAKPSVAIELSGATPAPGNSRFGGRPLVPVGFDWPEHEDGEYRFLGQINFTEIKQRPKLLPDTGLVSIFFADDEDGEVFWGDDGYVLGYYWDDTTGFELFDSAPEPPATRPLELTGSIDIPRHSYLREDWPFDEDALSELMEAIQPAGDYLLGHPSFTSLAYDPTPDPGWTSLLTVHSWDRFDWNWHDGDKLMVFIETDKLASRDFSHLKSDAG